MFYTYDKFGWYEGTSEYRTTYSTHVKPTGDLKSGYQYNWYGDRWEIVKYTPPPDIPVIVDDSPLTITPFAFVRRFAFDEELAARNLAKTDEIVDALLDSLKIVENVDLRDERVIGGLKHLVTSGILTEERVSTILNAPIQDWEK